MGLISMTSGDDRLEQCSNCCWKSSRLHFATKIKGKKSTLVELRRSMKLDYHEEIMRIEHEGLHEGRCGITSVCRIELQAGASRPPCLSQVHICEHESCKKHPYSVSLHVPLSEYKDKINKLGFTAGVYLRRYL